MQNARTVAVEALIKLDADGAYSNIVIDKMLSAKQLSKVDAAFASALFYGVLERRLTIDHILSGYLKRPLGKTDSAVLNILRTGICQLKFMDKVPDNAAVNESVKCCVYFKRASAKGLVNAVLRRFISDGKAIRLPRDETAALSVRYSVPVPIVRSLRDDYGSECAEGIMRAFLEEKYLAVRVNTAKISTADFLKELEKRGVRAKESALCRDAVKIYSSGSVRELFGFNEGLFHVQDIASGLCVQALSLDESSTLLDVCAAPGGKTFTAAEQTKGAVVACDLYPHKVRLIESGAARLGLHNVRAVQNDASVFNEGLGKFDRVLCDLPCSGLGILGKKPEIRYKNVTFVDNLSKIQYDLLEKSANYVSLGGILVYSTCTLRHNENGQVADRFLRSHSDFEAVPLFPEIRRAHPEPSNQLTLMPHIHHTDGFFISSFRRIK